MPPSCASGDRTSRPCPSPPRWSTSTCRMRTRSTRPCWSWPGTEGSALQGVEELVQLLTQLDGPVARPVRPAGWVAAILHRRVRRERTEVRIPADAGARLGQPVGHRPVAEVDLALDGFAIRAHEHAHVRGLVGLERADEHDGLRSELVDVGED